MSRLVFSSSFAAFLIGLGTVACGTERSKQVPDSGVGATSTSGAEGRDSSAGGSATLQEEGLQKTGEVDSTSDGAGAEAGAGEMMPSNQRDAASSAGQSVGSPPDAASNGAIDASTDASTESGVGLEDAGDAAASLDAGSKVETDAQGTAATLLIEGSFGTDEGLICSRDDWCWENPLPQGNTLRAIWAASESDVWAVGDAGTVLHFDGTKWSNQSILDSVLPLDTTLEFTAVWGSSSSDVWIIGVNRPNNADATSYILHWEGSTWTEVGHPEGFGMTGISGTASDDIWISGAGYQGVLHYDGLQWEEAECQDCTGIHAIWAVAPDDVWQAASNGALRHFNGDDWSSEGNGPGAHYLAVWGTSSSDVYFAGTSGAIAHWDGVSVEQLPSLVEGSTRVSQNLHAITGTGPDDVWFFGDEGRIIHKLGDEWILEDALTTKSIHAAYGIPGGTLWTAGASGQVNQLDGGGWLALSSGVDYIISAVAGSGPGDVWFGGTGGLLHWDESAEITREPVWPVSTVNVLLSLGADSVWAGGQGVSLFNGTEWSAIAGGDVRALWGASENELWSGTAYNATELKRYTPEGGWQVYDSSGIGNLRGMGGNAVDDIWGVNDLGVTYHYDGEAWTQVHSGTSVALWAVAGLGNERALAVGGQGTALYYADGFWAPDPAPTLARLTSVARVPTTENVWVTALSGEILYHNGTQWSHSSSGTNIWLTGVYASNTTDIWVSGSDGAILHKRR